MNGSFPTLFWDRDCNFCRLWVGRWAQITGDRVEYEELQNAPPDIVDAAGGLPPERIVLRLPNGDVLLGAEAALAALAPSSRVSQALLWGCRKLPGVGTFAEAGYSWIARHRGLCSKATKLLWGKDVFRPSYEVSGWLVPRLIGLVFFVAFLSLQSQIFGLAGERGILPACEQLAAAKAYPNAWLAMPSLLWFGASDGALQLCLAAGIIAAALLAAGVAPPASALAAWACYLSFAAAIPMFLDFQWDALLLESGLLLVFYTSWRIWLGRGSPPSRWGRILLWLLIFRLMFESGIVKLHGFDASGRNAWLDGSALDFHYFTQPIPAWTSWYVAGLPHVFHRVCVAATLAIELIVPFFIFGPRRIRMTAFWCFASLMALIALSGNYGFFNLLTLALCVSLVDDASWPRVLRKALVVRGAETRNRGNRVRDLLLPWFAATTIFLTTSQVCLVLGARPGEWAEKILALAAPWRSANSYGLFSVMTTERPEIAVEVSGDATNWTPVQFSYKVQPSSPLPFFAPHMPRLDWMMWFAALEYRSTGRPPAWLPAFLASAQRNGSPARRLLATDPPDFQFVRLRLDLLQFTSREERDRTGKFWKNLPLPDYTVSGQITP